MSTRIRGLVVGVVSAVLVLLLAFAATERKSPGRVSTVHGRIDELRGGEACAQCHGGWFGDMHAACTACHEQIQAQIDGGHGLHGAIDEGKAKACSSCHGEHHGDDFQLVNRLAFSQAGVSDPDRFDHSLIGFELGGAHTELACSECHEHAEAEVLPHGAQRFLGLSRDCGSCHGNPHGSRMQFACATCHSQESFAERRVLDHDRFLALDGVHGELACRTCHGSDSGHALEELAPGQVFGRDCADCHRSPHADAFVAGIAADVGQGQSAVCVDCHGLHEPGFAASVRELTVAEHRHTGFALAAPHDEVACEQCHQPAVDYGQRYPRRTADDCAACHQDPHGGQFLDASGAPTSCLSCHERVHFEPHTFDAERHARTAMPLDGQHAQQDCEACHVRPAEDEPRRFRATSHRCESCHRNAHAGAFLHKQEVMDAEPRGACAVCHDTSAFADLTHAQFDHGDWARFRLDGAHGQIACEDCHARTDEPDAFGRRFGRIPEHTGGGASCARCHGDPHEGAFSAEHVPADVDGRAGCLRCHDTASFRALPHGFDHERFAGFALQGKHGELGCTACHPLLPNATSTGRTWGKAKGTRCADCHQDPHQRQFDRGGATDCTRCHKSATTFATLSFRHNLDSRFRLGDQHRRVACNLCHKTESKDGHEFVRYKPLPTKCVDCHGREEGGASRRRRRR